MGNNFVTQVIAMKEIIVEKLKVIEQQNQVRILYACESGSRAWGFASPNSDFDVRFIYVRSLYSLLSVSEQRDVIELPINDVLDINGWELRKALRLFRKSNATLYEWLQSPVVYYEDESFSQLMRSLMPAYFSGRAAMHHYLSMARGVFENELSDDMVRLKKYFYSLRPVLAARWIAEEKSVPPMRFDELRQILPRRLNKIVDEMLHLKAAVDEGFMIKRQAELHDFILESISNCQAVVPGNGEPGDVALLDRIFRKYIL